MAGKILIVDDTAVNRIVLRVKLARAYYSTVAVENGHDALAALPAALPDLVLLDIDLPDMSGLDVLSAIRGNPSHARLPVIIVTAARDRATRLAALSAGADDILTKPVDEQLLLARIRSLRRRADTRVPPPEAPLWDMAEPPAPYDPPAQVAVVTLRPDLRLRLGRDLAARTGHIVTPLSREELLARTAGSFPLPELCVLDADTSTGLHLVSELRSRSELAHCGLILLCDDPRQAATAFDMGVDEVLPLNADAEELALRLAAVLDRTRKAALHRLRLDEGLRLALTDPLTGLHNLRYAERELGKIADRARTTARPFALLFIDLDRFKTVNDRFGHSAGDLALVAVAQELAAHLRTGDMLARIGGEEFLLALPGLDLAQARAVAERLCQRVQDLPIDIGRDAPVRLTVSIGLAIGSGVEPVDGLRDRADRALLIAKSGGRNRVSTDYRLA